VASIIEPTAENLAAVKKAVTLPFGWAYEKGKPVSPWARLGKNAWPKGGKSDAKTVCSKTGRPALQASGTFERHLFQKSTTSQRPGRIAAVSEAGPARRPRLSTIANCRIMKSSGS